MSAASSGVSVNDRSPSASSAGPSSRNPNLAAPPLHRPLPVPLCRAAALPPTKVSRQSRASGPVKSYRDASAPRRIRPPSRCLAPGAAAVPGATAQPARPSGARSVMTRSVKSWSARSADAPGSARPAAHSRYAPEPRGEPEERALSAAVDLRLRRGGQDAAEAAPPPGLAFANTEDAGELQLPVEELVLSRAAGRAPPGTPR